MQLFSDIGYSNYQSTALGAWNVARKIPNIDVNDKDWYT